MILFEKKVFAHVIKLKINSYWVKVGPKSNVTVVLIRRGKDRETQRQREGRSPCGDGGRDCSVVSTSEGMPKIAVNHQKVRTVKKALFPEPSKGS